MGFWLVGWLGGWVGGWVVGLGFLFIYLFVCRWFLFVFFLFCILFKPNICFTDFNCLCMPVCGMFAMFAKRTLTRPTTEYGSSKRKGWTAVCELNPSTFRNTTDRNAIMKSCYLYTCSVPLWPDIRHYSRMDNGYRKGPTLQRHVPA